MKAKIEDNIYGKWLIIIPESRTELVQLRKLWTDSSVKCKKLGCCIHADGVTKHGIENSSFIIHLNKRNKK